MVLCDGLAAARLAVMAELSAAAAEGYGRCLPSLLRLSLLREIEQVGQVSCAVSLAVDNSLDAIARDKHLRASGSARHHHHHHHHHHHLLHQRNNRAGGGSAGSVIVSGGVGVGFGVVDGKGGASSSNNNSSNSNNNSNMQGDSIRSFLPHLLPPSLSSLATHAAATPSVGSAVLARELFHFKGDRTARDLHLAHESFFSSAHAHANSNSSSSNSNSNRRGHDSRLAAVGAELHASLETACKVAQRTLLAYTSSNNNSNSNSNNRSRNTTTTTTSSSSTGTGTRTRAEVNKAQALQHALALRRSVLNSARAAVCGMVHCDAFGWRRRLELSEGSLEAVESTLAVRRTAFRLLGLRYVSVFSLSLSLSLSLVIISVVCLYPLNVLVSIVSSSSSSSSSQV